MNQYRLFEDGHDYDLVDADNAREALSLARGNVDPDNYPGVDGSRDQTIWISIRAVNVDDATDYARGRVALDPDVPPCDDDMGHDWRKISTHGHGGGVIVVERCARCRRERITDTWASDPETGEQGLTCVEYRDPDDDDDDDDDRDRRVLWFQRNSRGKIVRCDAPDGYATDYYPGPGEAHADQDGIWFEYRD